jgi:hypothetical protein
LRSDKWDKQENNRSEDFKKKRRQRKSKSKIRTVHFIEIDEEFQLKGSRKVQKIFVKYGLEDCDGRPLKPNVSCVGMNDSGDVAILNEGYWRINDLDYKVETIFENAQMVLQYGNPNKLLFTKKYSYKEIYKFQEDLMQMFKNLKMEVVAK